MSIETRAKIHAALGDPHRLSIVDELQMGDRTFLELADAADVDGNLVSHHLKVLEGAGLISRRVSEGDRRRRYISLRRDRLPGPISPSSSQPESVLFVCTHNSARSQFAAAKWSDLVGGHVESAGTDPAERVHPKAVRVAAEFGIAIGSESPRGYDSIAIKPDLVVSVCDRARESRRPFDTPSVHWSIPDPVASNRLADFRRAFTEINERIDWLSGYHPAQSTP